MVRACHRSSEGCGFDPRLGLRNHFLSIELDDRSSTSVLVVANVFQMGVYDAVAHFNNNGIATIKVLQALAISPGALCLAAIHQAYGLRVNKANYKSRH